MGVNTWAYFPPQTRIQDVAKVAAALLGHESRHTPIAGSKATFARTKGWAMKSCGDSMPECAYLVLDTTTGNPAAKAILESDGPAYNLLYHFEIRGGKRGIGPTCAAAKIALAVALVEFFGGTLDINDCDETDVDLRVKPKADIDATDDPQWSKFQKRILAVKPLTKADIAKWSSRSVY